MALLDIENLKVSFFTERGEIPALGGVSLSLERGRVLGIVGESGSGKSVTAYSVLGLLPKGGRIIGGSIRFMGEELVGADRASLNRIRGNRISMIFQDPMTSLNPTIKIGKQITEAIRLHTDTNRHEAKKRAINMLRSVGIRSPEERMRQYPHELSGGMRQRVMIAMALVCEPDLLIADEPTTALDVTVAAEILDLLKRLGREMGMAIMMITHDLGTVAELCDEVAVMYGGRVCERGKTDDVFYNPCHEYTCALLRSVPSADKSERLVPIGGAPIDLSGKIYGCPFAPRCDKAMHICLKEFPREISVDGSHSTACYAYEKRLILESGGENEGNDN